MGLNPDRAVGDSAFLGVPLGPKPLGAVGAAGSGWTAIEMGLVGMKRRTVLKHDTPVSYITTPDTEALAGGKPIYTFPAGQIIIHEVYGDIGVDIADDTNDGDQPEVGIGVVVATGAVATLGAGASTWEDVWGPHIMASADVIGTPADAGQFVTRPGKVIIAADAHVIYLNIADTWANGAGTADVFIRAVRFIIDWSLVPTEGL